MLCTKINPIKLFYLEIKLLIIYIGNCYNDVQCEITFREFDVRTSTMAWNGIIICHWKIGCLFAVISIIQVMEWFRLISSCSLACVRRAPERGQKNTQVLSSGRMEKKVFICSLLDAHKKFIFLRLRKRHILVLMLLFVQN